jgi:tetratricopeptide (TPR) repeat protein
MSPKKKKPIDPLERAIEEVLNPGSFVSYNMAWSFVDDVQKLANDIEKIIKQEPTRAANLLETFIAACHEKADEIDDSSGNFGMLVEDLFRGWIKARQAAGNDRGETANSLISWMENDPYGFCHDLDRVAVKVLDKKGINAFLQVIREKFESSLANDDEEKVRFQSYSHRRWSGAYKTILVAQRNVDAYIALCKKTELKEEDCKEIAKMYRRRRRFDDALAWVDNGLKMTESNNINSFVDHELYEIKRTLLTKLGRSGEALRSAWSEFKKHPSVFSYKELMRYVPAGEKEAWHKKAMKASEKGDLSSVIKLWLDQKEIDRLVKRLRRVMDEELEDLSHYTTEPLARKLKRSYPDIAGRLYRALCMRIVNAGKSKYYEAALENIEHAKNCYRKAGLDAHWKSVVTDIRERHYRKKGFMAGFEEIISDPPKLVKPTFLERAKARWPSKK